MEEKVLKEPTYSEEIVELVKQNSEDLSERLLQYHDNDIAKAFETLDEDDRKILYSALGAERMSDVFAYVEDPAKYIEQAEPEFAAEIIENMDSDDAVDVLEEVDDDISEKIVSLIDEERSKDIQLIQSYDEDEIGSRMTTNFIEIKKNISVKQAMRELVKQAEDNDNISTIYVCDDEGKFCGAIDLKDLIIARQGNALDDIISTSYPYVRHKELVDDCLERIKDYEEDSIPVLDDEDRILGVITAQDIVEAIDDEMGEDYAKLAGLTAEEDLNEPLLKSMKKRLPWLLILLVLGVVVSTVVGMFEPVIAQLTIIVCFQSLILDMAGNVGTQSLAVTIRVLMDEQLTGGQRAHLVFKEMRVALCNGLLLGMISFLIVGSYLLIMKNTAGYSFAVSACVGAALMLSMLISGLVGTCVPMFFHKLKVDPAVASGPLITTVNDLVAVVTYYGLAWLFLINLFRIM